MALQSTPNQAFLGNDGAEDDLAALDSMSFTGSGAGGGGSGDNVGRIGDGRDGAGFSGVSESLFDRIKARTAEQQKQAMSASSSSQQPSAFVSQQQQTSSEPTMEEHDKQNSTVMGGAVAASNTGSTMQQQQNNSNNETTYSLSASTGEDFSFQPAGPTANPPLRVPQYGASRDDPYYTAINNSNHQYPISIQDKASIALAQTGESVKSLWEAGVSGARAVGAMAQDKIAGEGSNNSFLLRGDGLEEGSNMMGSGGGGGGASSTMSQPPPAAAVASGDATGAATSDQAYSMLAYFKTFCEDVFGFVMQLPPWGKGVVAVILLWVLYFLFG